MLSGTGYKIKTVNANFLDQEFREEAILRTTDSMMLMGWCENAEQDYIYLHFALQVPVDVDAKLLSNKTVSLLVQDEVSNME